MDISLQIRTGAIHTRFRRRIVQVSAVGRIDGPSVSRFDHGIEIAETVRPNGDFDVATAIAATFGRPDRNQNAVFTSRGIYRDAMFRHGALPERLDGRSDVGQLCDKLGGRLGQVYEEAAIAGREAQQRLVSQPLPDGPQLIANRSLRRIHVDRPMEVLAVRDLR
jgi:hypothetical protein